MDLSTLLRDHVYTAILVGSLIEGETTVILAGFAAHQGYAPWLSVAALAAAVNFVWDQGFYALGRWRGEALVARWPALRRGADRLLPQLHRHRRWLIFGVRFMYGLRTAGPMALGMARVPWRDFVLFNALGAMVWASLFAALGYLFGRGIAAVMGRVAHAEGVAVAAIAALGLAAFAVHKWRASR